MSAAEKTTPLDPLIRQFGVADDYPSSHRLTFVMDAGTARVFLHTLRHVRRLYLLRASVSRQIALHQSNLRIAAHQRRRADEALYDGFRDWYWALTFSWLTLEFTKMVLS